MIEIKGKYNKAKVFTDIIEDSAINQIEEFCNQKFSENLSICIMPDVHSGKGCVIGFTANLDDIVIPSIVGVDIGCGMLTINLGNIDIDFTKLDEIIRTNIPYGKDVHVGRIKRFDKLQNLHCYRKLKYTKRIERSIGSLGGGNHFIEVDKDDDSNKYLVIHTGSRNLGKQVAEYYKKLACDILLFGKEDLFRKQNEIIKKYKEEGRKKEIQNALIELKKSFKSECILYNIPEDLCYLKGEYKDMYLDDMKICQEFATFNRFTIANIILKMLLDKEVNDFEYFETIHNYINYDDNIVRKGAVSAKEGEKILIPINMRDGSIICIGKGNKDWNYSAPHGAGRLFSRTKAKEKFSLDEFKDTMKEVYSTSVNENTLDESPMAYKGIDNIINNIGYTAEIIKRLKPLYNFKA